MTSSRPDDPKPGDVHADCVLGRLLGRGGMGSVFLATRQRDGQPVVVKFLAPEFAQNPKLRQRFQREWNTQRKVHPHPNVARVFDVRGEETPPCLTMEFAPGKPLDSLLREHGRLPARRAALIARDMARGLAAVHAHGLIHRDVKPGNAIVSEHGAVKIVDFGLAKDLFLSGLTQPGEVMGTALYMAPEQWEDEGVDARCDVFALGATLYHLLCGRPPFEGDDMDDIADACQAGDYDLPRALVPDCPPELELVICRALMTDVGLRYQRIADLGDDLDRVLAGQPARVPALLGERGERFPLIPAEWLTLGSAPACKILLAHPSVAPKHAQIRREANGFVLRDMKSPSGTFVAGERLPPGRARPLRDGDSLRFGAVELRFSDPLAAAAEAGAAFVQDVERRDHPGPLVEALARLEDPRAFLSLLEGLQPDRYLDQQAERDLASLLGQDVARAASAARQRRHERLVASLPARLNALTQVGIEGDPAQWLGWWHQVRTSAPLQVGAGAPPRDLRLRVTGGLPGLLELPLRDAGVVLLGRDPRCQLRFDLPSAPRLHATLLRLHRRWIVVDEGSPAGTRLNGAPVRWAFVDPGDQLALGGVRLAFEAAPPPPPPVVHGTFVVDPASYEALLDLRHPAVCCGLVATLAEAAQSAWLDAAAAALSQRQPGQPEEPGQPGLNQQLRALLQERALQARQLLPSLLGQDRGADLNAWRELLAQRRADLPAQLLPRGWLAASRT